MFGCFDKFLKYRNNKMLYLNRTHYTKDFTQGVLTLPDGTSYHSIENPWVKYENGLGGTPFISCVPEGTYKLIPHSSTKWGETLCLVNENLDVYMYPGDIPKEKVKDKSKGLYHARATCLIHVGNTAKDVQGCIALGMTRLDNPGFVGSSKVAVTKFYSWALDKEGLELTISS